MNVEYRRNYDKSFMLIDALEKEAIFEEQMLARNRLRTLLPLQILTTDGKKQFWYNITGKDSLRSRLEYGLMSTSDIRKMFYDLQSAIKEQQEYLLDPGKLLLTLDGVFVDRLTGQFLFVYCICQSGSFPDNVRGLYEEMLRAMDHRDMSFVTAMYKSFEVALKDTFSIEEIIEVIDTQSAAPEERIIQAPPPEEKEDRPVPEKKSKKKGKSIFALPQMNMLSAALPRKRRRNPEAMFVCEEQEKWEEEPKTRLISVEAGTQTAVLKYAGTGSQEDISLGRDNIYIGSSVDNQGVIVSSTVSKRHARVTVCKGEYFVEDLNSTNGTYVNGSLLSFQEKRLLQKEDRILFADELYVFI